MRASIAMGLLMVAASAWGQSLEHPFARQEQPVGWRFPLGLEWGRTTLSYSQTWLGSQSLSQAYLLKDLRAPLASGLTFNARFGLGFSPGGSLNQQQDRQPELVIPYAALSWQPSEHFLLRLEYSHPGQGAIAPYGLGGWWAMPRPSLFAHEAEIQSEIEPADQP